MPYNDAQLLHIDQMLTEISVGFDNPDTFTATMLAPAVKVTKDSDRYYVQTREVWGRATDDLRSPGARANELPPMTLSRDTYFLEEHALKGVVPIEEQPGPDGNADAPIDSLADTTEQVTNTILLNRELAIVTMATTTTNYNSSNTTTLSGTSQWSDYTNSDPIGVMKTARQRIHDLIFADPNTIIMGYQVAAKLEDHTKLIARYQALSARLTDEQIAALLGVPRYVRAGKGKLTNVYGQAETYDYLWGKDVVLAYVPPRPGRRVPAFMYEFYKGYARAGGQSMPTERWYDKDRDADILRVRRKYDLKFIYVDGSAKALGGYLIKSAIA
jgi:hypothetical protein